MKLPYRPLTPHESVVYAEGYEDGRRDAAELRAAVIEWWSAMRDYRYVVTPDVGAQNERLLAAENRLADLARAALAAAEKEGDE